MNSLIHDFKQSTTETMTLTGVVKWFDLSRGFGFVLVSGFDAEFLLHVNVLRDYGQENAAEGAAIEFRYVRRENGLRVSEVLAINATARSIQYEDLVHPDRVWEDFVPARVKWFDKTKGFGFVNRFGCTEDVFVGSDVLNRCGLQELSFGQALSIQVCEAGGRKRVHEIKEW